MPKAQETKKAIKKVESESEGSDSSAEVVTKKQKLNNTTAKNVKPEAGALNKKQPAKKVASSDSESEEEIVAPKGKAAQTKAPQAKAQAKKAADSESEDSDAKPAKGKPAQAAKGKPAANKKMEVESGSESSEPKPAAKGKNAPAAKGKAPVKAADSDSEESEVDTKAKAGKKAQPAAANKKAPAKKDDSDSESDDTPAKGKAPAKGKVAAKKAKSDSEDESEPEPPKKGAQAKKVPAKKSVDMDEEETKEAPAPARGQSTQSTGDEVYEVFVRGLSYQASDYDLKELFSQYGEVTNVNLLTDKATGRSKGLAFVKFNTDEERTAAVEATNGMEHMGRSIVVEKATPKEGRAPRADKGGFVQGGLSERDPSSSTVFVGNLAYGTTEESLSRFFEPCGKIKAVRIAMHPDGQPRGFGHVEFASPDCVDKAVGKAGEKLDGRPVKVDYSAERKGGNDRGGDRGGFGGGFGGNRDGGFRGGRGGSRGGRGGSRGGRGDLTEDDINAKKGNIGEFQGKKMRL